MANDLKNEDTEKNKRKKGKKKIICFNGLQNPDDIASTKVLKNLSARVLPKDVEIIDGHRTALDLLWFMSDANRIVFIDSGKNLKISEGVKVLNPAEIPKRLPRKRKKGTGLVHLLRMLPMAYDQGQIPEIKVIGIAGESNDDTVNQAADLSLDIIFRDPCLN